MSDAELTSDFVKACKEIKGTHERIRGEHFCFTKDVKVMTNFKRLEVTHYSEAQIYPKQADALININSPIYRIGVGKNKATFYSLNGTIINILPDSFEIERLF